MNRNILFVLLLSLLLADTGYTLVQHYFIPFDGDMAGGIVPANDVKPILDSPLGLKVFTEHCTYPNPNRFFCHWSFYGYFNTVPLLLQNFTNPLDSAYLSCALAKTSIQLVLILMLALAISGDCKFRLDFILSAVLVAPLFQTNGYRGSMGIVDPATTYSFFYALPAAILMLYFAPLFLKTVYGIDRKGIKYLWVFWIPLALVSSLSGPLNPGISLVVCLMLFGQIVFRAIKGTNLFTELKCALKMIPADYYFYLAPIFIFSVYSLFLGRYNSLNLSNNVALGTLYSRLPVGLYFCFTQKLGFPVLFFVLSINTFIIKKLIPNEEASHILRMFKWIGIFSLLYILLLPLGGYRSYRPNVLRYDTIIPVTLCLMFIFGKTTLFILKNVGRKHNVWYVPFIMLVLFVYIKADRLKSGQNEYEKKAIIQIAQSSEKIVEIEGEGLIMSWIPVEHPSQSELNCTLLKRWRILRSDKLYYQPGQSSALPAGQ